MLPQFCHCRSNTTKRVRKSLTPSATPLIVKKRRCFSRVSRRRQLTYTVSAINFSRSAALPTWHGIPIATSPLATNSETVASTFACFREDTTTLAPKKLKRHKGYICVYMCIIASAVKVLKVKEEERGHQYVLQPRCFPRDHS